MRNTKKIMALLLAVSVLLLTLCACGEPNDNQPKGELVSLSAAYADGLISDSDVLEIAYRWHDRKEYVAGKGFVDTDYSYPALTDVLDKKTEEAVVEKYKMIVEEKMGKTIREAEESEGVAISFEVKYLGKYNGKDVCGVSTIVNLNGDGNIIVYSSTETIAGTSFHYNFGGRQGIFMWN